MTDSLNPYQPTWVQIDSDQEDSLWEGMHVRPEGYEPGEPFRVVAIRGYDVDVDGDGYGSVTHSAVRIEKDGEWYHLEEVEFLVHELEWGQARYDAKVLMRRITYHVRQWGKAYCQSPPSRCIFQTDHLSVAQYNAKGRRTDLPF
jgi:hypothetical protein